MSDQLTIARCPAEKRIEALRILADGMPEDERNALVLALDSLRGQDESIFDGLLVATQGDTLISSIWVQLTPGKTALVWPPYENQTAAKPLMRASVEFLDQNEIYLAQILCSPELSPNPQVLEAGEFQKLASLTYLTADKDFFPQVEQKTTLNFDPNALEQSQDFGNLLIQTYKESLDCPALNGVRKPTDIIEGYRTQGTFHPECWFRIRSGNQDVGTLILASHAEGENWELVYMGIVPEARGNGFGWQTLQFALWQAKIHGAARMILAVDESNEHALQNYRKAGFVLCDRRTVFARMR